MYRIFFMINKKYNPIGLIILVLYFVISFSTFVLLKEMLPGYGFFFVIDGDGEIFDRKLTLASFIGLPITYIAILGFSAWKNKWDEVDNIIRRINEKFDVVGKLESELKEQNSYNSYKYYEEEQLLEKIKKAIERTYK